MFKRIFLAVFCLSATGVLIFAASRLTQAQAVRSSAPVGEAVWRYYPLSASAGDLNPAEKEALAYMREEEKLAHDVYVVMSGKWGAPLFWHLSMCEQMHTSAAKNLLDHYGLADPASSSLGVFANPALQSLYDDLLPRGSQSLAGALSVGAAIEEIDYRDLEKRLAQAQHGDIQRVFGMLMNGTRHHLRLFVSNLNAQTGQVYQPRYLSQETYQSLTISGMGTCGCRMGRP